MEGDVTSVTCLPTVPLSQNSAGNKETDDPPSINITEHCSPSEIAVAVEITETLLENCHGSVPPDRGNENNHWLAGTRKKHWIPEWIRKHYRCYEKFVSTHFGAPILC